MRNRGAVADEIDLIQVVIADDHPVVRMGLSAMLDTHDDIEVMGDVKNVDGLLSFVTDNLPDVLILDLQLEPECEDGMASLRAVRAAVPDVPIVVYTAHDDEHSIVEALGLGVEGYILKDADPSELVKAIHVVHCGGSLLQAEVASKLMRHMRNHPKDEQQPSPTKMSRREMDVLNLMAEGKSNNQIASKLVISERTVKFHVSSILGKLEVANRTAAVLKATRIGILASPAV
ncbi:MAG: response regulator transcription factor [Gammaproteobacteria bacterium]|nr:response regulator transcription factor [Gammaproteobacteria bacterium]